MKYLLLVLTLPLTGCLVVRYSSGAGWSLWPGSLLISAIILILTYLLNRRH